MRTIGIDVSHWEGLIDWQQASRYLGFVYYKCTDGLSFVDPTFEHNRAGCNQVGLAHAPYHYFQPGVDPLGQAEHFIKTAGKNYKRYIVDVEEDANVDVFTMGADLLTFIQRCYVLTGIRPAVYTSPGYWNEHLKPIPGWARSYELIVAHYTAAHRPTLPAGWDAWIIWQFSDYYFVPGCSSEVDGDWFNGDLLACRQWFGNYREIEPAVYSFQARSYFDNLHVRVQPSILAREVDHLAKGDAVIVEDLGGRDVWVRHSQGWTCVEKDGYRYMEVVR